MSPRNRPIPGMKHQRRINPFKDSLFHSMIFPPPSSSPGVPITTMLPSGSGNARRKAVAAARPPLAIRLCPQACPMSGSASYSNRRQQLDAFCFLAAQRRQWASRRRPFQLQNLLFPANPSSAHSRSAPLTTIRDADVFLGLASQCHREFLRWLHGYGCEPVCDAHPLFPQSILPLKSTETIDFTDLTDFIHDYGDYK